MKKYLRILVVFDTAGTPPKDQDYSKELETEEWKTEADVIYYLEEMGHEVEVMGIYEEIDKLYEMIKTWQPDIVFNLTEHFGGKGYLDRAVVGLYEMMNISYTGCGPEGLMLCRHKALTKKILTFHRIKNPKFTVIKKKDKIKLPKRVKLPCIIKSASDDASRGISKSSVVEDFDSLVERVNFIHKTLKDDALVETFIPGRELYVSILGNKRLQVFPIREIVFRNVPASEKAFATYKAKWDEEYRNRWGIKNVFARGISEEVRKHITHICKRVYKALRIDGYARIDLRLTPEGEIVVIEANPNPFLAEDEDFAMSAARSGLKYDQLIRKIVNLGFRRSLV